MNRRTFLRLPTLLPFVAFQSTTVFDAHQFQFEGVVGTSMDLVVWTPDSRAAEYACQRILEEIDRLVSILNTRDPASEISLLEANPGRNTSHELNEVLDAYDCWRRRTHGVLSIRPCGVHTSRNVDALGKAYILDQVSRVARESWPSIDGLLLNIGGDIVVYGRPCKIAIADPDASYDNAAPIATIALQNAAVATSGTYARGAHLTHARNGQVLTTPVAATVVAADAVTANALATTLCLVEPDEGLRLVEAIPGAEALRIAAGGAKLTSGFALLERPSLAQSPVVTTWPPGYHLTVTLPLKPGRSKKRPYVAVWVEDSSGKLVRVLAVWGNKYKYYPDLSSAWNFLKWNDSQLRSVTRATRPAGKYELEWDGLDSGRRPVALGSYRITVETNQENGSYAKQSAKIILGDATTTITLPATTNFDEVLVRYGPS